MAVKTDEQILIHTPHLEDKYQGTRMILDMLTGGSAASIRERVLVDHVEEHTIRHVLEAGFWAGMTLYPVSKCTPERAVDMVEMLRTGAAAGQFRRRLGPVEADGRSRFHPRNAPPRPWREPDPPIVYDNPLAFFRQSRNFQFQPPC